MIKDVLELRQDMYYGESQIAHHSSILPSCYTQEDATRLQAHLATSQPLTITTLHVVDGNPVPVRWLASPIETIKLIEALEAEGAQIESWRLFAPIHANAAANDNGSDRGLAQATALEHFLTAYIDTFHSQLHLKPSLATDTPTWVQYGLNLGNQLFPHLPEWVQEKLLSMAQKHNHNQTPNEAAIGMYLLTHYHAYGLLDNTGCRPITPQTPNIYLLPPSEETFLSMMADSTAALQALDINTSTFKDTQAVILISNLTKAPPYYANNEPLLVDAASGLPTINQLSRRKGLNAHRRQEIIRIVTAIKDDIGPDGVDELGNIIDTTLEPWYD